MAEKKRKKGCLIGCVSALAAVTAAVAFVPLLRHMFAYFVLGQRPEPNPEYAGVLNAIEEIPYAHAYLPTIDRDAKTLRLPATVESNTDFIAQSGNVIRNVNTYLLSNPDAPEHQYEIEISFCLENDSEPMSIRYYNYDAYENSIQAEYKQFFFRCNQSGRAYSHPPQKTEAGQIGELEFLNVLEIEEDGIAPEDYVLLDSLKNLQTLRIQECTAIPNEIREHLKEAHPRCRILINNTVI